MTRPTTSVLEVEGLSKSFRVGSRPVEVVRGIDLEARSGEVVAFLGPNGAGKTTTIKMISGLIRPDAGKIRVCGRDPQEDPGVLGEIGAVLEGNRNLYWRLSAMENLEYFAVLKGCPRRDARRRANQLLERFGLTGKASEPVRKLSRGMQQKLACAAALIHRPRLLLLDEPTLGLDPEAAEAVKLLIGEIAAEGRTVLLTTHQLQVAEAISHRVSIIREGEIVVQEATPDLLRRFRGEAYRLVVDGRVDGDRRRRIEALGGVFVNGHIELRGDTEALYGLLEALRPLPLLTVEKEHADLTEIFLDLVRREQGVGVLDGRVNDA